MRERERGPRSSSRRAVRPSRSRSTTRRRSLRRHRRGRVVRVDYGVRRAEVTATTAAASRPAATITALGFVLGDRTLVVGDAAGGVSTWQLLPDAGRRARARAHPSISQPHPGAGHDVFARRAATRASVPAMRSASCTFRLSAPPGKPAALLGGRAAPAAFDLHAEVGRYPRRRMRRDATALGRSFARIPRVSLRSLFGKVWYEGYEQAGVRLAVDRRHATTSRPSSRLTPLVYGTLKGTFYALLFAVPIALLGALYASQFMHPRLKRIVKPTVEIMAALPSVVLGFMAGLWLAPAIERIVPALSLLPFVDARLIAWSRAPGGPAARSAHADPAGTEVFLLIPVVVFGGWLVVRDRRGSSRRGCSAATTAAGSLRRSA